MTLGDILRLSKGHMLVKRSSTGSWLIRDGKASGAKLEEGDKCHDCRGFYGQRKVFSSVSEDMKLIQKGNFEPV